MKFNKNSFNIDDYFDVLAKRLKKKKKAAMAEKAKKKAKMKKHHDLPDDVKIIQTHKMVKSDPVKIKIKI
jgi:hypothetical protein